jgi:uncharacterized repeat protein (TIGR02543 family)
MNDGTDTTHATGTVTAPATTVGVAAFPANPTRGGYNFTGWNTVPDGTGVPFTASTTVSGNITVYAQWTQEAPSGSYTVTFKWNDGTDTPWTVKNVAASAALGTNFPDNPSRTGYVFESWNTEASGPGTTFIASTPVSANITVYARWTVVPAGSRTVTFMPNDGTTVPWAVKYVIQPATATADFPADPTRNGHDFKGWNTRADGLGKAFDSTTTVTANITVYAQWAPSGSYIVTFNLNDGTDTNLTVIHVTPAATIGADFPTAPSRNGCTFEGWGTAPDGTGTPFTATTPVTADITVYALWLYDQFDIILDPDGGDGAFTQASFTLSRGGGNGSQTVTVTGGYTDPRWFVDGVPAGTGPGVTVSAADYSLGSHTLSLLVSKNGVSWSKEISFTVAAGTLRTVIFRTNDDTGAVYAVRTAAAGSGLGGGFPADPVRDGYDFSGWNTQAADGGSGFTATTAVSADTTVYAKWTGKIYTVTFMQNHDSSDLTVLHTKTVTVPATVIADFPINPSRSLYNFAGWNTEPDGSGTAFGQSSQVDGNITVYAGWTHGEFAITLDMDAGGGAFSQGTFTVYQGGGTGFQTVTVTGSGYTNPRWFVDGESAGTGNSIDISAADYTVGGHSLTLLVTKGGASWSREITFIVAAGTLRTVIFRTNDDTGAVYAVRTTTAGSVISGFPGDPVRDDYTFSGWDTASGGGGSAFTGADTVSADTTVYAQWTGKTYTVTFMRNYDSSDSTIAGTATVLVPAKTVIAAAFPAPTWGGYNFAGWNTEPDASGAAFGQTTEVHGDITVYAGWAPEQFGITLDTDAGTGAFGEATFNIAQTGNGSKTIAVTGSGYTSPRWFVDGVPAGTGTSVTIYAADYTVGGHSLTLLITKNGVSWSKEIAFKVTN